MTLIYVLQRSIQTTGSSSLLTLTIYSPEADDDRANKVHVLSPSVGPYCEQSKVSIQDMDARQAHPLLTSQRSTSTYIHYGLSAR